MAHTDAHRKLTTWTDHRDLRHYAKPKAEREFARMQQGSVRTRERAACRDAVKSGVTPELDTRHRHNAAWITG